MNLARAWVIAREISDNGRQWLEYWTGGSDKCGWRSSFRCDAFHFTTPGAAYECAQTHSQLRDSDQWRVVPADPRLRSRK